MPTRILIIKPSALGDVATTLPMLCDLHDALPSAKIDWLIHPAYAPLLADHSAIHELIPFERKKLAPWWYKPAAFTLFRQLLARLRSARYDCVIDAQGLFRSAFLARITAAPTRIGFAHAREAAPLAYTHKVRLPDAGRKMLAVDRMRALLAPLKIDTSRPAQFRLPVSAEAAASLDTKFLATIAPRPALGPYAVVIPGARWNTKRWPTQNYAAITQRLLDHGLSVLLLGSPDEKPLCDEIVSNCQFPVSRKDNSTSSTSTTPTGNSKLETGNSLINLAGITNIPEMIAALSRAALIIANDSGPLHVAIALGRPVVAIYGPTDPAFVGAYGQLEHVIRHPVPCHPCRRKQCSHHSCMAGVTVDAVWNTIVSVNIPH